MSGHPINAGSVVKILVSGTSADLLRHELLICLCKYAFHKEKIDLSFLPFHTRNTVYETCGQKG